MASSVGRLSLRITRRASPCAAARPICCEFSNSLIATSRSLSPISRTISAGSPATRTLTGPAMAQSVSKSEEVIGEGRLKTPSGNNTIVGPSQSGAGARLCRLRSLGMLLGQSDDRIPLSRTDLLHRQALPFLEQRHAFQLWLGTHF